MTPRDKLELIGWSSLALTALILFFSLTRGPSEWYEWAAGRVTEIRDRLRRKSKAAKPGRHHVVEDADGPDVQDDPQVADHPGDDSAHQDGEKETA